MERDRSPHELAASALMQGRVDEAVGDLQGILSQDPSDDTAHLLLCRAFYSEAMADQAVDECEAALQGLGKSSEAQDWMGRAYGLKANRSGPIAGYKLAHKVRTAFETAVELDPTNPDAANDLSEYYIHAPAMVGGGLDKASALAERVQATLPQPAHRMQALIAQQRKDYGTAEREFKAATAVAGVPDAWADLARFYAERQQYDQGLDAVRHCLTADTDRDASVVDAASILTEMHREPELAERILREYLDSGAKSDAAPVIKVRVELAKLRLTAGDKPGAKIELNKALELAKDYELAKRELQRL
jgi:tetratricopeptide (TPR) repeat protein